LLLSLVIALGVLIVLIADIWARGSAVLIDRGIDFITAPTSSNPAVAGVWQGIIGSLIIVVIVMLVAYPIGLGSAIYLEEYAKDTRLTRILNAVVRNLAGVPAIVFGLLGLAVFVVALSDITGGRSVIAGGLTMAALVMPIVVITTGEALRAVPQSIRRRLRRGRDKVGGHPPPRLPYAAPGIFTGSILTLSRAFGETAPLVLPAACWAVLPPAQAWAWWSSCRARIPRCH
jgi:phosphate transport system permease protein